MGDYLSQLTAHRSLSTIQRFVEWVEARAPQYVEAGNDPETSYKAALREGLAAIQTLSDEYDAHEEKKYTPGKAVDGRLTLTLGELLDSRQSYPAKLRRYRMLDGVRKYIVYIVRDGDEVLYVGASNYDAQNRIRGHLATGSALGKAIRESAPVSDAWQVEMISHPNRTSARAKEKELQIQFRPKFCNDRFLKKEQPLCQQS